MGWNVKRKMSSLACLAFLALLATGAGTTPAGQHAAPAGDSAAAAEAGPRLENLMTAPLEGAKGIEVIVSRVTLPPRATLPRHWHPGEEFAYVLEGSVTLWQKGKDDIVRKAGEVAKVPLKQIHTAIAGEEGATILVFRVHEQGKPERIPAE